MTIRSDRLRRRRARLEPRPRILLVCEGTKTEPEYFSGLRRQEEVQLVEIVIGDSGGAPKTLVERAVKLKKNAAKDAKRERDDNLRFDEVWCVFDVDEHPKLHDALQQARDNSISVAVSNPCFELWMLLHFRDQTAHIHRDDARHACGEHIPSYDKSGSYAILRNGYDEAVRRAVALDRRHAQIGEEGSNPSTWVYRLTERLKELGRGQQLRRMSR